MEAAKYSSRAPRENGTSMAMYKNSIEAGIKAAMEKLTDFIDTQHKRLAGHNLSEGGITDEFVRLLHEEIDGDSISLEVETKYSEIEPGFLKKNEGKDAWMDVALKSGKDYVAVIEMKRYERPGSGDNDVEKLAKLKSGLKGLSCYLLLATQSKVPKKYIDVENGRIIESVTIKNKEVNPLWIVPSAWNEDKEGKGNCTILLEILAQ